MTLKDKKITINIETDKDDDMIKASIIYSLRKLNVRQKDIEVKDLEDEE